MFNKVAQNISGGKMEKGTREQNIEVGPSGSHTARNEGLRPTLRAVPERSGPGGPHRPCASHSNISVLRGQRQPVDKIKQEERANLAKGQI